MVDEACGIKVAVFAIVSEIYVLSNKAMPGLVKIGRTSHGPLTRAKQLYSTGVPFMFEVEGEWSVPRQKLPLVEDEIHFLLDEWRVNDKREFFALEVEEAIEFIDEYIAINGFSRPLVDGCFERSLLIMLTFGLLTLALLFA